MIIRCYSCKKLKGWNKDTGYKIELTSFGEVVSTKKICVSCANIINNNYETAKRLHDVEVIEETE